MPTTCIGFQLAFTFFSPPGGSATEPSLTVSRSAVRFSSTPQPTSPSPSPTSPTPTAARTPRRDGGILTPTLCAVGAAGLLLLLLVIGVATVLVAVRVLKARAGHREKEQMSMHGMTLQYSWWQSHVFIAFQTFSSCNSIMNSEFSTMNYNMLVISPSTGRI